MHPDGKGCAQGVRTRRPPAYRPAAAVSVDFLTRGREGLAARDVAAANASYLIANNLDEALPIIVAVGGVLKQRFGAFMLLDVDELDHDTLLTDDAPYLPPFEIRIAATGDPAAELAETALADGADTRQVKFRTPRVERFALKTDLQAAIRRRSTGFPLVAVRFAPIYRQPEIRARSIPICAKRLVANIFDAGLQGLRRLLKATQSLKLHHASRARAQGLCRRGEPCRPQHRRRRGDIRLSAGGHADQRRCGLAGVQGKRLRARAAIPLPAADRPGRGGEEEALLYRLRPL